MNIESAYNNLFAYIPGNPWNLWVTVRDSDPEKRRKLYDALSGWPSPPTIYYSSDEKEFHLAMHLDEKTVAKGMARLNALLDKIYEPEAMGVFTRA